ncbi:MAG TPA: DUF1080 domain-containing protein [Planctomycetota bacterium]|nr:DUF1080 domain-containing protein [Planctomycetota bacterium]
MTILMALLVLAAGDNELSEQEKKDGWTLLFDGKSPEGWVNLKSANVEDGCINPFKSGNYVTFAKERYGNFVLACDFKISKGCNSGIFIRTDNPKDPVQTGIEIQVYDTAGKEKPGRNDGGAIYDLVAPSKNAMKPAGEWNHIEITCDKNKIKVALNGESIADMDLDQWTEAGKNPDGSKNKFTKALKDFAREGLLGFQDHGQPCWYKNIKLKKL